MDNQSTALDVKEQHPDLYKRFNRLLVYGITREFGTKGVTVFRCLCDCGTRFKVRAYDARSGKTKSCGCSKKENLKNIRNKRNEKGS